MLIPVSEFRARIRERYKRQFEVHQAVAARVERAYQEHRQLVDPIHLAIDMLMTQAYKAHLSVRILAEHAHVEDAATISRRLLEISVQTVYIGEESEAA